MLEILILTALSVGVIHTAIGIDHTVPFVVLARAKKWSLGRTMGITFLCGVGHVLSSVILGLVGIALGITVQKLQWLEEIRGEWAAWFLIGFGLIYAAWALASQRRETAKLEHHHSGKRLDTVSIWSLFIIFVLGPCEPLIPLMLVPALKLGAFATFTVVTVFSLTTIGTMMLIVALGYLGIKMLPLHKLERHVHTLTGIAIALSGAIIQIFDL